VKPRSSGRISFGQHVLAVSHLGALDGVAREFLFLQIRRAAVKCAIGDVKVTFVSRDPRVPLADDSLRSKSRRATRRTQRSADPV
jgi:hypothetical protein